MILGVASYIIQRLCYSIYPESSWCQLLWAKEIATWSQHQSEYERQQSVNDLVSCILHNLGAGLRHLPKIVVLAACKAILYASILLHLKMSVHTSSTQHQQSINTASIECQQSVNDFGCCILYNPRALLRHMPRISLLAAVMSKRYRDMVTTPVCKWASTEHQRFSVLHLEWSKGCVTAFTHNRRIGSLYMQYGMSQCCYTSSINGASTIVCPVNKVIHKWFARC
jgi:hypothetical protein